MLFRYLQLKHAIQAQFPDSVTLAPHSVEQLLMALNIDRALSSIYLTLTLGEGAKSTQLYQRWQQDIPSFDREDWDEGIQQVSPQGLLYC